MNNVKKNLLLPSSWSWRTNCYPDTKVQTLWSFVYSPALPCTLKTNSCQRFRTTTLITFIFVLWPYFSSNSETLQFLETRVNLYYSQRLDSGIRVAFLQSGVNCFAEDHSRLSVNQYHSGIVPLLTNRSGIKG